MYNNLVNKNNCDKFIFKGALALESYYDDIHENKELFDTFNNKLKRYRLLSNKTDIDKDSIANDLLSTLEKIGMEKFIIYEDGNVEYNYNIEKGEELNVK